MKVRSQPASVRGAIVGLPTARRQNSLLCLRRGHLFSRRASHLSHPPVMSGARGTRRRAISDRDVWPNDRFLGIGIPRGQIGNEGSPPGEPFVVHLDHRPPSIPSQPLKPTLLGHSASHSERLFLPHSSHSSQRSRLSQSGGHRDEHEGEKFFRNHLKSPCATSS